MGRLVALGAALWLVLAGCFGPAAPGSPPQGQSPPATTGKTVPAPPAEAVAEAQSQEEERAGAATDTNAAQAAQAEEPARLTPVPADPPVPIAPGLPLQDAGSYVVELETRQIWRIAQGSAGMALAPAGPHALRYSYAGGLDVVDLAAGTAQRLYAGGVSWAEWSPDGSRIAFTPRREGGGSSSATEGLYVVDRDGENLRRLAGQATGWRAGWSPTGEYLTWPGRQGKTYLLPVAGGEPRELAGLAAWAPDGSTLALGSAAGVELLDLPPDRPRRLSRLPVDGIIRWSPDGRWLLTGEYVAATTGPGGERRPRLPRSRLFSVIDLQLREPWALPLTIAFDAPAWSPAGDQLAFVTDGCTGPGWDLWLVAPDRSHWRQLTRTPGEIEYNPTWSPDGRWLVYGTGQGLTLVDVDSGREEQLVAWAGVGPLLPGTWQAGGRYLAFSIAPGRGVCD